MALLTAAWPARRAEAEHGAALAAAAESVQAGQLRQHVQVLADDTFEGREAGSRGGRAASVYLYTQLKEAGLEPAGEQGGYFQSLPSGGRNVLGMIPGSDPELQREVVVFGGHFDHVGYGTWRNSYGPTGYIHNGADDNASGVAGMLEIIEALSLLPQSPRRTILFAFWDGEEKGLLGSKHWTASPTIDFQRVVFAFNVDMIGRLNQRKLTVFGSRTSTGLRQILARSNHSLLQLEFDWQLKSNSDHHSFFSRHVPVLMLHTGLHEDYHRPSDDEEKLNYPGMQAVTRLLLECLVHVADADATPRFRSQCRNESDYSKQRLERALPQLPPRLGVAWSHSDDSAGLLVTQVTYGSAADRAGLRHGDRLISFDGQPIEDEAMFRRQVLAAPRQVEAVVRRTGEDEPVPVDVTLEGEPVRLGISWRQDSADPGLLLLVRVVPSSPAADAGLRVGDRVYEVDGQPLRDSQHLQSLVAQAGPSMTMLVERHGQLSEVTLRMEAGAGDAANGQ